MSRHLDNLERLFNRLQLCVGTDDELTQQVSRDLQRLRRAEPEVRPPYDASISYSKFVASLTRDSRSDDTPLASR